MASNTEAQVYNAHSAKIMVAGVEVGFAQGINYSVDHGTQDVVGVGSFKVLEHQQTIYRVQGSIAKWVIRAEVIKELNKRTSSDILATGVFDLEATDKVTGQTILRLEQVTLSGGSSGVQAGQLVTKQVQFKAIETR